MNRRRISFETLNSYVDGELDAAAAAEVARAAAEQPALARELAALSRLRSAVAESIDAPALCVRTPVPGAGRQIAVAASVSLAVFIAATFLVASLFRTPDTTWLERTWQVHRTWSVDGLSEQSSPTSTFAQYAEAVPEAYVPDLSASRLSLAHAAVVPFVGKRRALLAGYLGTRGCRITLLIFPSPHALGEGLDFFRDGGNEAYGWRAGRLGYVILSDGMDPDRFRLLAESVRKTSRNRLPFNMETRIALRTSRDRSAPCMV